jgi:hypothetical protein
MALSRLVRIAQLAAESAKTFKIAKNVQLDIYFKKLIVSFPKIALQEDSLISRIRSVTNAKFLTAKPVQTVLLVQDVRMDILLTTMSVPRVRAFQMSSQLLICSMSLLKIILMI